jgi:hypothetical protein
VSNTRAVMPPHDRSRSASKRALEGSSLGEHPAQRESKCACAQQRPFESASVDLTLDSDDSDHGPGSRDLEHHLVAVKDQGDAQGHVILDRDERDAHGAASAVTAGAVHVAAPSENAILQVCFCLYCPRVGCASCPIS